MAKYDVAALFVVEADDLESAKVTLGAQLVDAGMQLPFTVPDTLNDRLENLLDYLDEEDEYEAADGEKPTVVDAGETCLQCGNSVAWGEGRYVNRVPADRESDSGITVDGWICAECEACNGECAESCACCAGTFDFEAFAETLRSNTYSVIFEVDEEDDPDIYGVTWFSPEGPVAETGYGFTRTFAEQVALEGVAAEDFEEWASGTPWSTDLLCGEDDVSPYPLVRVELSTQDSEDVAVVWTLEGSAN